MPDRSGGPQIVLLLQQEGGAGQFLAVYDYLIKNHKLDRTQKAFLKNGTFHGNEIVAGTRRLCLMNLFLHTIGEIDGESCVSAADALIAQPSQTLDLVLANPPFGKKSSMTFTNEEGEQERDDLTYNRQDVWYYDYRTNIHHTLKRKTLTLGRPPRVHHLLQPRQPPQAQGNVAPREEPRRPLAEVHL